MAMEAQKANGKRILVVEDDQDVRKMIALVLKVEGYLVTEARHGVEALNLFAPGQFDLVLTDFEMPEMNGAQLIENLRVLAPDQRIGIVSANVHRLGETLAKVNFHLHKPFIIDDLRQSVKRALE